MVIIDTRSYPGMRAGRLCIVKATVAAGEINFYIDGNYVDKVIPLGNFPTSNFTTTLSGGRTVCNMTGILAVGIVSLGVWINEAPLPAEFGTANDLNNEI